MVQAGVRATVPSWRVAGAEETAGGEVSEYRDLVGKALHDMRNEHADMLWGQMWFGDLVEGKSIEEVRAMIRESLDAVWASRGGSGSHPMGPRP